MNDGSENNILNGFSASKRLLIAVNQNKEYNIYNSSILSIDLRALNYVDVRPGHNCLLVCL